MVGAQAPAGAMPDSDRGRLLAVLVYGLYLAAFVNGITAIIGVVLAYVGRSDARGTVYESHFSNAITVFWVSFAAMLVLVGLAGSFALSVLGAVAVHGGSHLWGHFNPLGFVFILLLSFGGLALLIWYVYRTVVGLVRALDGRPW